MIVSRPNTYNVILNLFQDLVPQAPRKLPEMLKQVQHDEVWVAHGEKGKGVQP